MWLVYDINYNKNTEFVSPAGAGVGGVSERGARLGKARSKGTLASSLLTTSLNSLFILDSAILFAILV